MKKILLIMLLAFTFIEANSLQLLETELKNLINKNKILNKEAIDIRKNQKKLSLNQSGDFSLAKIKILKEDKRKLYLKKNKISKRIKSLKLMKENPKLLKMYIPIKQKEEEEKKYKNNILDNHLKKKRLEKKPLSEKENAEKIAKENAEKIAKENAEKIAKENAEKIAKLKSLRIKKQEQLVKAKKLKEIKAKRKQEQLAKLQREQLIKAKKLKKKQEQLAKLRKAKRKEQLEKKNKEKLLKRKKELEILKKKNQEKDKIRGKELSIKLNLIPNSKTKQQWKFIFGNSFKERKYNIKKLSDKDKRLLKTYLIKNSKE